MAEEHDISDTWFQRMKSDPESWEKKNPQRFLEISRTPKKMDIDSLVSLIVRAARIVPVVAEFVTKNDEFDETKKETVVLVEFRSEMEAINVVSKLRSTPYGKSWNIEQIRNPKTNRDEEIVNKWLN